MRCWREVQITLLSVMEMQVKLKATEITDKFKFSVHDSERFYMFQTMCLTVSRQYLLELWLESHWDDI